MVPVTSSYSKSILAAWTIVSLTIPISLSSQNSSSISAYICRPEAANQNLEKHKRDSAEQAYREVQLFAEEWLNSSFPVMDALNAPPMSDLRMTPECRKQFMSLFADMFGKKNLQFSYSNMCIKEVNDFYIVRVTASFLDPYEKLPYNRFYLKLFLKRSSSHDAICSIYALENIPHDRSPKGNTQRFLSQVENRNLTASQEAAWHWLKRSRLHKDHKIAIALAEEALRINPDFAEAHYCMGWSKQMMGDQSGAVKAYKTAIACNEDLADAYCNLGLAEDMRGNYDEAIKLFTRGLEIQPDYPAILNNRALTWENLRKYKNALADYERAIEMDEINSAAALNSYKLKAHLQDYEGALADSRIASERDPNDCLTYLDQARFLEKLGRYKESYWSINSTIHLFPNFALAYEQRGNLEEKFGDNDSAIEDYRTACRLDKNREASRLALIRLTKAKAH